MKQLYKEVSDSGHILSSEEQEDPYIMIKYISTKAIEATKEEVEAAKQYFTEHKKCLIHFFYDKAGFMYDSRICGICNKFITFI